MRAERSIAITDVMSGATGVVFDKDGTLIDLDARWQPFFSDLIDGIAARSCDDSLSGDLRRLLGVTESGLVVDAPAAVESGDEIGARIIGEMVAHGQELSAAHDIALQSAGGARHGPVEPVGEVARTLASLSRSGLRLGIATSDGVENTRIELAGLDLADAFDSVRCADDGGPVKPDPAVLLGIATEWSIDPSEMVFVGDSRQDLATAQAAGTRFIARCTPGAAPQWACAEADAIVADIAELIDDRRLAAEGSTNE